MRRSTRMTSLSYVFRNLDKILFVFGLLVLSVGYGMAAVKFELFPYPVAREAVHTVRTLYHNKEQYIENKPAVLEPTDLKQDGVVRFVSEKAQPGVTLVTSFFDSSPGIRLVSLNGTVLHSWQVSLERLWPDLPHLDESPDDLRTHIHGAILEPEGNVVLNVEYKGLFKLDRQGQIIWRLPYETHHSVDKDWEGNYWVCGRKPRKELDPRIPMIQRPFWEEFILQVSPQGKILQEISVFELIFENGYEGVLLGHGPSDIMLHGQDLVHLNDIKVLHPKKAEAFAEFQAGDLLVSLRNLNMICVVDARERRIKWHHIGHFLRQHDPHFLDDGTISVFDNRDDQAQGQILGGSRIVTLDPGTGRLQTLYQGSEDEPFFTGILGKHQHLENDNILITEGQKGRVFEVTSQGEIVWEYVHKYDEDHVAWVEQGQRYPYTYVKFLNQGDGQ